jgi:hypothetical protein
MHLPIHLVDAAVVEAIRRCEDIEDVAARDAAIRRAAAEAGAEKAFSLVARWLAATCPDAHDVFLAEFR